MRDKALDVLGKAFGMKEMESLNAMIFVLGICVIASLALMYLEEKDAQDFCCAACSYTLELCKEDLNKLKIETAGIEATPAAGMQ